MKVGNETSPLIISLVLFFSSIGFLLFGKIDIAQTLAMLFIGHSIAKGL